LHGEGDKHGWHGGAGGGLLPGSFGGFRGSFPYLHSVTRP
jgi:hypothetical protein